uniref:Putative zeta toxin domain protein n=1 Tax=viral metagenome TaxID=1070528 RepID=A0A6M3J6L0_9ZZZZ
MGNSTLDLLSGGKFFIENPDRVLGEVKNVSTKYGGEGRTIEGDVDIALAKTPGDVSIVKRPDPNLTTDSVVDDPVDTPTDEKAENIEKALKKSEREIAAKKRKKKQSKIDAYSDDPPEPAEVFTFEETYEQLNRIDPALPAIGENRKVNDAELKAFVWYKESIGDPLSAKWYRLAGYRFGVAEKEVNRDVLVDWIAKGAVCFYQGELIPSYIYYAENMYERKIALDDEKDQIISMWGEKAYNDQKKKFDQAFEEKVYSKRLQLNPADPAKQLVVLPNSDFAQRFRVSSLAETESFRSTFFSDSETNEKRGLTNEPDWLNVRGWKEKHFETLPLRDAFCYWLRNKEGRTMVGKGITWYDIIRLYIEGKKYSEKQDGEKQAFLRKKQLAQAEGNRLFKHFLANVITDEDRLKIETEWNMSYNSYVSIDYDKIPVAFEYSKYYRENENDIRFEKRDAVAFMMDQGSGCVAYQVGLGKTWSSIFTIKQFLECGYCKRPLIVVPKQTYRQWIGEIRDILGEGRIEINELFNLNESEVEKLYDENGEIQQVKEGTISIVTHEGFKNIGFSERYGMDLVNRFFTILNQGDLGDKEKSELHRRLLKMGGIGLKKTLVEIEKLGFDFLCFDEAHAMKKVFTRVAGKELRGNSRRQEYAISTGTPSDMAIKGFALSNYIQSKYRGRNVMLLTATPFTNSPLEVFSMFALIGYEQLKRLRLNNLNEFFDNFVQATYELTFSTTLKPQRRQVFKGWNNVQGLQRLLFRMMIYKEGDMPDEKGRVVKMDRPDKYILPYKRKVVDGQMIMLDPDEIINTTLSLSALQEEYMNQIQGYVVSGDLIGVTKKSETVELSDTEEGDDTTEADEVNYELLASDERLSVRIMQGVGWCRSLALSPYLFPHHNKGDFDYLDFVEDSPKLLYAMKVIESIKKHHKDHKEPMSGVVLYMDRGKDYFEHLRKYLVNNLNFKPHEVKFLRSGMPEKERERIKNSFNGVDYDLTTGRYNSIPDEERIKVLIGSSTIKEGINLQSKTSTLINCFLEWNPTDYVQVEGRVWRQGNQFNAVRIVIPLMFNSIDIFMFQKIEEKVARINAVWNRDGRTNIINIQEFDPQEAKYELVSDPTTILSMELDDEFQRIDDEIVGIDNQIHLIERLNRYLQTIETYEPYLVKVTDSLAPRYDKDKKIISRSILARLNTIDEIVDSQKIVRGEDTILIKDFAIELSHTSGLDQWDFERMLRDNYSIDRINEGSYWEKKYTYKFVKPNWYKELRMADKDFSRKAKETLEPQGIPVNMDGITNFLQKLNEEKRSLGVKKGEISSEEAQAIRLGQIIEDLEARRTTTASPAMRVAEFNKLNHLLSDVRIKKGIDLRLEDSFDPKVCPPVDKDGNIRIDAQAITQLEKCIKGLPPTKEIYASDDEYSEDRKKLHEKIINKIYKNTVCLERETPILILTAGPSGSGKSYFLQRYAPWMQSDKIVTINNDDIKEDIPEYKGWNSAQIHEECSDITRKAIAYVSKPCRHDVLYDGTMNTTKNYFPLINRLKTYGYKIFLIFVSVPKSVSYQRVLDRYQITGRYVPKAVIDDFYGRSHDHFDKIKSMVDGWIEVDGVTSEILQQSGMTIPKDRFYFTEEDKKKVKSKVKAKTEKKAESKRQDIKEAIELAKLMMESVKGKEKQQYEEFIELAELMLDN